MYPIKETFYCHKGVDIIRIFIGRGQDGETEYWTETTKEIYNTLPDNMRSISFDQDTGKGGYYRKLTEEEGRNYIGN